MARILLADDDRGSLDLVRRALQMDGHTVTTAEDGADALSKLENAPDVEVLVTDVQMPGLDGISLAKRALALNPNIRLVMMSAYPDVLDKARHLRPGALHLVPKPFSIDKIRSEVRAALAE